MTGAGVYGILWSMKARWTMACECCKAPIYTGGQFVMYAGRPWKPRCLIAYKGKRRVTAK